MSKPIPEFHLPFPVFDSHFHALNTAERLPMSFLGDALDKNLSGAMEVAIDEYRVEERLKIAEQYPQISLSAGIHPSSTNPDQGDWSKRFKIIKEQVKHPRVKAVGETGLDFFREHSPRDIQIKAFADHLELAAKSKLPVIIHCRDANEAVFKCIEDSRCRFGIFHCFSAGPKEAERALELGFYISFAGNISYKKSENTAEAARIVPLDRVLIETDSPYLAPQPVRGNPNHPGYIGHTLEKLSEIRNEAPENLAKATLENAHRIFA